MDRVVLGGRGGDREGDVPLNPFSDRPKVSVSVSGRFGQNQVSVSDSVSAEFEFRQTETFLH